MKPAALLAAASLLALTAAEARDEIRVVGSAAAFPYTQTVAEHFAQTSHYPAPFLDLRGCEQTYGASRGYGIEGVRPHRRQRGI